MEFTLLSVLQLLFAIVLFLSGGYIYHTSDRFEKNKEIRYMIIGVFYMLVAVIIIK